MVIYASNPRFLIPLGRAALFSESYLFPFMYAFKGLVHARFIYSARETILAEVLALAGGDGVPSEHAGLLLAYGTRLLSALLCAVVVWGLVTRKRVSQRFDRYSEIFVPLVSIFLGSLRFQWVKDLLLHIPGGSTTNLYDVSAGLTAFGLVVISAGLLLSIAGFLNLGTSTAVFVELRTLVTSGPYRYLHHPIYTGYALQGLGNALINPRRLVLLYSAAAISLLIYRAALEERRLTNAYPAYAAGAGRSTRFLLWLSGAGRRETPPI